VSAPVQVGRSTDGGPVRSPDWGKILTDVGGRLRAERRSRGWSVDETARRAGIRPATMRRMEAGSVHLHPMLRVCWAFRVPVGYLLSDQWKTPSRRPTLALRQVDVLREAASGDPLEAVAARLGMGTGSVGSALSRIYVRLGVEGLPRKERRAAAVRVAMQHGLFDPGTRTS